MPAPSPPIAPMLARLARELPVGDWSYEPKWDGFRCLVFRTGTEVHLQSRNLRPLGRYFPDVVDPLLQLPAGCVLDGELLVLRPGGFAFPDLMARIHPSASRIEQLLAERPATFTAFDCLADGRDDLTARPFSERREALERLLRDQDDERVSVTPVTRDVARARVWFDAPQPGWDGIVAKSLDSPYQPGKRAMIKVKPERTADCVVAGVRLTESATVSSLLLGLWTPTGELHHPGVVTSSPRAVKEQLRAELPTLLVGLEQHPWQHGFGLEGGATGRLKGAGSRWLPGMTQDWLPVAPVRVVEVAYDAVDGLRFRHPARFRRWRPDRDAASCLLDQLAGSRT